MTTQPFGVDYAFGRITGHILRESGIAFVCRYLSHDPAKNLTAAEVKDLHGAGIGIVLVWESGGGRAADGELAGIEDAHAALAEAEGLGVPGDVPIYFAVDFDALSSQMAAIHAYFIGVRSVLGYRRTGVYGGIHVVQSIQGLHGKYGWQTLAWSAGQLAPAAQLYQFSNDHTVDGVGVDFDRAEHSDYGAWQPSSHEAHAGPHGIARATVGVDLENGHWTAFGARSPLGHGARFGEGSGRGRWEIEPLPAEGEYWCAKIKVNRGR